MNDSIKDINKYKPHFLVYAFCFACFAKWTGVVCEGTSLFELECFKCGERNSFATVLPWDFK